MIAPRTPEPTTTSATRRLEIELLFLDVTTCGRCKGTDSNLESALADVASLLREAGVEVSLSKRHVDTAALAVQHRFVSSPTIRINGQDVALELRESDCQDCGEIAGCGGGVDCRVWVWQGREHTEAPRGLIIDAVLRAAYGPERRAEPPATYALPENLRRFYEATATSSPDACCAPAKPGADAAAKPGDEACCASAKPGADACCATAKPASDSESCCATTQPCCSSGNMADDQDR
jgi:hypothetical protein